MAPAVAAVMAAPYVITAAQAFGAFLVAGTATIGTLKIFAQVNKNATAMDKQEAKQVLNSVAKALNADIALQDSKGTKLKFNGSEILEHKLLFSNDGERTAYFEKMKAVTRFNRKELRKYRNGGCVVAMTNGSSPRLTYEGRAPFSSEFDGAAAVSAAVMKAYLSCYKMTVHMNDGVQSALHQFIPQSAMPSFGIPTMSAKECK